MLRLSSMPHLDILCAVLTEGFWASTNRGQRRHELLNVVMRRDGSPPETLGITIPVTEKLMKKTRLAEPPALAACFLPRQGHESGAGSMWPLGLLASRSPSPDKMGLGNQLPIIASGLSHAVNFTVQGRRQTARLDVGGVDRVKGIGRKYLSHDGSAYT